MRFLDGFRSISWWNLVRCETKWIQIRRKRLEVQILSHSRDNKLPLAENRQNFMDDPKKQVEQVEQDEKVEQVLTEVEIVERVERVEEID